MMRSVLEIMIRQTCSIAAVFLLMMGSASAFDHNRRGFALGFGIGFSPSASWKTDPYYLPENTGHSGFAAHALIGGGINEHNILVSEWNMVRYSNPTELVPAKSVSILQWHWAISWYHYYGQTGKSLYSVLGIGPYFLTPAWNELTEFGGAIMLGAGYEFTRHLQIGVYYSIGRVANVGLNGPGPNVYGCDHLSVLLTVIGY